MQLRCWNVQVTKEVFEASKGRLKVVGRAGVGVDNVDLASATDTCPSMSAHSGLEELFCIKVAFVTYFHTPCMPYCSPCNSLHKL